MLIKKKNLISKGIISRTHLIVLLMMLMSIFVSCAKLTNDDGGEKIDKTGIKVIEGRVVDGPISGATVYLDINKNGEMDNNEPKQLSDDDGYFRFEADVPTGTVVISRGGVDTVTGEAVEELIGETLGGEFVYISPLTTVLQGVEASKDKTREENRKELLEALGIDFSESEVFTKNTYKMATKEGSESEEDERKKAEKVEKLGMQLTLMIKTAQMVAEIDAGEVSQKEVVKALLGALIEEKKSTKDMQLENKELVKNVLKKVKETVDEKVGMSNPSNNDSKINTIAEGVANGNGALNQSNFKEISEESSETKKIINDAFQLDQQVKEFLGGTITKEKFEEDIKILIVGCMNPLACNYNEQASIDIGSCEIPVGCNSCSGERDGTGVIVNNDADNDGVCDANDVCDSYANSDATALPTWYEDEDGDGYYSNSSEVCADPGVNWNLSANSGNDSCPIDSSITTVTPTWYEDSDGDGLGNGNVSESSCTKPSGYVSNADDSDDVCSSDAYQNWYVDSDEDGYGAGSADSICTDTDSVSGKVTNNNDACPIDSGITTVMPTWYEDLDGDGLGNGNVSESICTQPIGYVSNADDSDDVCNSNAYQNWYVDSDGDGYGAGSAESVCIDTVTLDGKVTNNSDACDSYANGDATALPTWFEDEDGDGYSSNSSEVCEAPGINWNLTAISGNDVCPLNADSTTVVALWYEDSDGDGLGNGNVSESICMQPSGYVSNTDDSDDACTNNSYQNWYVDSDEDGYGTGSATSVCTDTDSVAGKVTNNSDACDSYANGDASALPTWYEDADGDGYYSTTSVGCESPGSAWSLLVKPANRTELVAKLNETVPGQSNTYYNGNSAATCGDINTWDTSPITNMSSLFQHKSSFNCDISNWDVSNVTNMSHMFRDNSGTSIPIGSWDVSNVVHMTMMFAYSRFNHDISNWNTSKVIQMQGMFQGNTVFNQPIGSWNVSNVTNMCWMFAFNSSFNQPLSNWDVSNVDLMCHMFQEASAFNQPLNNWDVSNVTQIQNIFAWSYAYDQDLSSWDTSKIRSGYFGGFGHQAGFSSTNKCKIHDAFKSNPAWTEDSSQNPWCN